MNHSHLDWSDREKLLYREQKLITISQALCPICIELLRFSPKYGNDALAQAEYFSKLKAQGMSRTQIAERFYRSIPFVDCRLRLWAAPENLKKLFDQGKIKIRDVINA